MFFSACVIIWLPFIDNVGVWVSSVGGGTPRELANVHTMFNVANALLFLPFIRQFAALMTWVTPDRPQVDALHGLILEYLGQISQMQLSEEASAP